MSSDEIGCADLSRAPEQQRLLLAILKASPDGSRSPTVRELARMVGGNSPSSVQRKINKLKLKRLVEGDRQVWLTRPALDWLGSRGHDTSRYASPSMSAEHAYFAPLYAEVAAGNPIAPDSYVPDEYVEEWVPLPNRHLPPGRIYVLRVRGDSMIGDHIVDGDLVVVGEYPETPKGEGEIVVALFEGDATVKHIERLDGKYWLVASNPTWPSRIIEADSDFWIQGRVIGVVRVARDGL